MKKFLILPKIHSCLDIITNSSTELFVCNKKKELSEVKEILIEIIEGWKKICKSDPDYEFEFEFDKMFDEPYIYTRENYEIDKANFKNEAEFARWSYGYEIEENIGRIIIRSQTDNSIPYELWDKINDIFDAKNYHLG